MRGRSARQASLGREPPDQVVGSFRPATVIAPRRIAQGALHLEQRSIIAMLASVGQRPCHRGQARDALGVEHVRYSGTSWPRHALIGCNSL